MKYFQRSLLLFLKGFGIGSVDTIPGISGSTIALITGVYGELLASIRAFDITALRLFVTGNFKALWRHIHGTFLLPLVGGLALSLVTTVQLVVYLLEHHPIQTWSFCVGVLLVAVFTVYRQIGQWHLHILLVSLGGIVLAYSMTQATPLHTPNTSWFVGFAGAVAFCAMLLPGISGSFMLLLLGKYTFMLSALKDFKLGILAVFALGGGVGLLISSRLIAWLLRQYHDYTLALLAGFMLGSLNKLWPWQPLTVPLALHNNSLHVTQHLSPLHFQAVFQQDPLVAQALLWMSLGILLAVCLERQVRSQRSKS